MTPRILVTVSRSWSDWTTMRAALRQVRETHPTAVLVHGDAPKGDRDAAGLWRGMGGEVEAWPADWAHCGPDCRHKRVTTHKAGEATMVGRAGGIARRPHCPYAGYRRNLAMVESAPDLVLAFINKDSKGATHCADAAESAGIPVRRYLQEAAA